MSARPLLFTRALGSGYPTLVFLPGVGGTTRYWESRVATLAERHRLVLVDPLGFGRSPKPWTRYTVDRHVAELRRVLAGCEPLALVGHSFGAVAAVAYATRYPEQVQGLVLLGVPGFVSLAEAFGYYRGRGGLDRWLMTNVALAAITCVVTRRVLGRVLPRLLKDIPPEVAEDLVLHTWRSSTSTIWEGVYRHGVARDAEALPPGVPVLCIHGDRDVTAPLEFARRLAGGRPGWTLRVLPGVDHHPLLRDPALCVEAIAEWVAALKPAGAVPP